MIKLIENKTKESLYAAGAEITKAMGPAAYSRFRQFRNESYAMIKAACLEAGIPVEEEIDTLRNRKIDEIEAAFVAAQMAGTDTVLGYKIRCTFDDALTIRQAAELLQRAGETVMPIRGVDNVTREGVPLATAMVAADQVGGAYLTLWKNREAKKTAARAATNPAQVAAVRW